MGSCPKLALERNPVRGLAPVKFTVAQAGRTELAVFDRAGRSVATIVNEDFAPGAYTATWNTTRLSPGVYFLRLKTPGSDDGIKAVVSR